MPARPSPYPGRQQVEDVPQAMPPPAPGAAWLALGRPLPGRIRPEVLVLATVPGLVVLMVIDAFTPNSACFSTCRLILFVQSVSNVSLHFAHWSSYRGGPAVPRVYG